MTVGQRDILCDVAQVGRGCANFIFSLLSLLFCLLALFPMANEYLYKICRTLELDGISGIYVGELRKWWLGKSFRD